MNDADLRSHLRTYLESAILQDQKLKNVLRTFARKLGAKDPLYEYLCAHMQQLASREVISEQLLSELQSDTNESKPAAASAPIVPPPQSTDLTEEPGRALDGFEEELVRTYNLESDRWVRKYKPASFGAANVDDIWRSGGEPKFAKKEGGIYHLVSEGGHHYVVPEPGLKLQDSYFRSEGLGQLFACPGLNEAKGRGVVVLTSPAIVEESGDRWIVIEKGVLQERLAT